MCQLTPEQEEKFNSGKGYLTREFVCKNCGLMGTVEEWINKKTICPNCNSEQLVLAGRHSGFCGMRATKLPPKKAIPKKVSIITQNYYVEPYKYEAFVVDLKIDEDIDKENIEYVGGIAVVDVDKEKAIEKLKQLIKKTYPHVKEFEVSD